MGTVSGCAQPRTRFGTFRASVRKAQELGGCNKCNMEFMKRHKMVHAKGFIVFIKFMKNLRVMPGRSSDYARFEVLNQLAA